MPSLSFKKRFAPKIMDKSKRQTIRNFRKVPIKVGDKLYLYTGLRTKYSEKLDEVICSSTQLIRIDFVKSLVFIQGFDEARQYVKDQLTISQLNEFAKADGFIDWDDMREFWRKEHGMKYAGGKKLPSDYEGVLIKWK